MSHYRQFRLALNQAQKDKIPANPDKIYSENWKDWKSFLGTEDFPHRSLGFLDFEDARLFVQSLKLK